MITCAKGMTSGYSPIGACIVSDRIAEPFWSGDDYFPHGYTFGGHPVSAAVAMANLDIFEREGLNEHVLAERGRVPLDAGEAARPADRRRRPRRRLLLRHRAGQGQGDEGDVRRRRVRAAAARLPVQGAVRRRPLLPRRRPRRPGRAARAAADRRPARVRRDRADPALGADRGLDAALSSAGRPTCRTADISSGRRRTGRPRSLHCIRLLLSRGRAAVHRDRTAPGTDGLLRQPLGADGRGVGRCHHRHVLQLQSRGGRPGDPAGAWTLASPARRRSPRASASPTCAHAPVARRRVSARSRSPRLAELARAATAGFAAARAARCSRRTPISTGRTSRTWCCGTRPPCCASTAATGISWRCRARACPGIESIVTHTATGRGFLEPMRQVAAWLVRRAVVSGHRRPARPRPDGRRRAQSPRASRCASTSKLRPTGSTQRRGNSSGRTAPRA